MQDHEIYALTPQGENELRGGVTTLSSAQIDLLVRIDGVLTFAQIKAGMPGIPLEVSGATLHLVLGRGFDYAAYREGVLKMVRDRWYRIPKMLPIGACYFCEKYFEGEPCGR